MRAFTRKGRAKRSTEAGEGWDALGYVEIRPGHYMHPDSHAGAAQVSERWQQDLPSCTVRMASDPQDRREVHGRWIRASGRIETMDDTDRDKLIEERQTALQHGETSIAVDIAGELDAYYAAQAHAKWIASRHYAADDPANYDYHPTK